MLISQLTWPHLERALDGDAAAFRALYDQLSRPLFDYVLLIVSDWAAAEDVVQETFLAVFRHGRRYDRARPFGPWVKALARHAAINHLRRRRLWPRRIGREQAESMADRAHAWIDPLKEAVSMLPAPFREALWLCDVMGLSYIEASAIMECSPGTVGSRVTRGRRRVRDILRDR